MQSQFLTFFAYHTVAATMADDSKLNQPICGTTAGGKIVGGSNADIKDYPFNVYLNMGKFMFMNLKYMTTCTIHQAFSGFNTFFLHSLYICVKHL